jgi:hypothetical protein
LPAQVGADDDGHPHAILATLGAGEPAPEGVIQNLLMALDLTDLAPAPLMAAGAGLAVDGNDALAVATPATLTIHGDDVRLTARAGPLTATYAQDATTLLDRHFTADGIHVVAATPDTWFMRFCAPPDVVLTPFDVARGGSLYAHRPRGPDARRVERWANEAQMLLHAHHEQMPCAAAPNGLWLWGLGATCMARDARLAHVRAYADAADASDAALLARGIAGTSTRELPTSFARWQAEALAIPSAPTTLIVLPPATYTTLATHWLTPAIDAASRGQLAALTILGHHGIQARRWHFTRRPWLMRLVTWLRRNP